jgi:hypothetical protein
MPVHELDHLLQWNDLDLHVSTEQTSEEVSHDSHSIHGESLDCVAEVVMAPAGYES